MLKDQPTLFDSVPVIESASPINNKKFGGDNLTVFNVLIQGKKINRTSPGMTKLTLHSRISDLQNKHKINIERKRITVMVDGEEITCCEYWLSDSEIKKFKDQFCSS